MGFNVTKVEAAPVGSRVGGREPVGHGSRGVMARREVSDLVGCQVVCLTCYKYVLRNTEYLFPSSYSSYGALLATSTY